MSIATVNPATGEVVETFAPFTTHEVERRLASCTLAHERLRETTFAARAGWMRETADALEGDVAGVARMLTVEMGKPLRQAEAEVLKCCRGMRYYAQHAEAFLQDQDLADPAGVGASRAGTRFEPMGVLLAVMPWNFPLWQVLRLAAPALMAGNTVLLKHAANVPRSARYLEALFAGSPFPAGSLSSLLVGTDVVRTLLEDPRVRAVSVTGSEAAGRSVASLAGAHGKKVVLELGGSDPFVVMPSADLERAASTAAQARLTNNGQSCIGAKRFIVHTDVYDRFTDAFTRHMARARVGDPLDPATDVGPLATESGREELAGLVADAVSKGATLLLGGTVPDGPGWYYPPTVLADVSTDMHLATREAFGPVATLYRVADAAEAVRVANQTDFGLSSSVWTADVAEQGWFVSRLRAGAVFVNGMSVSHPELPFGGVKASGYGRELAADGIREFCDVKTVWEA